MIVPKVDAQPFADPIAELTQLGPRDIWGLPDNPSSTSPLGDSMKMGVRRYSKPVSSHPIARPWNHDPDKTFSTPPKRLDSSNSVVELVIHVGVTQPLASQSDNQTKEEIFATNSHDELLGILRKKNLTHLLSDYQSFLNQRQEDLEEGESPDIILQSLQAWAWFMIDCVYSDGLPHVRLRADHDGCARLIWRLSEYPVFNDVDNEHWGGGRGIAVLKFFPSGLNYFSMMSGPFAPEKRRLTLEGYLSHDKTKRTIDMFSERLLDEKA